MFEKLVSVLPYNPNALHQLAFYGKRVRQESGVRRTGLVFIVLAFLVQFFAVLSPPVATVAYSSNDMINGGFTSQSEAVSTCKANTKNYGDVLSDFGITCTDVASASVTTISSTDRSNQLFSMGWLSYGQKNPRTNKTTDETPLNLSKVSETLYARKLSSFDTYSHSDYKALVVKSSVTGKTYYILYTCGNLVAVGVPVPVPLPKPTPPPTPKCPLDSSILITDAKCKTCQYDNTILKGDKKCIQCPNPNHPNVTVSNPQCVPVCKFNKSLDTGDSQCKPCTAAVSSQDSLACIVVHKTAANLTQGLSDANGTTVHAGDTLVYTLYAQNQGKATVKGFVFQENISDILDYAKVSDLHGGSIDSNNEVTWPAVDIKAKTTAMVQVTVQVDAAIPGTPPDPGDPGHFDHIMTNVFGNTVNIDVPQTPLTPVVTAATTLPNTGPGTSLFIGGVIVVVAGYFFSRSRLLATEAGIAVKDTVSGGL